MENIDPVFREAGRAAAQINSDYFLFTKARICTHLRCWALSPKNDFQKFHH